MPVEDSNQDWTLHSGYLGEGYTKLSFSRAFDTCDTQDYPITVKFSVKNPNQIFFGEH